MRTFSPRSPAGADTAPEVYPLSGATDLLGRMPVRLRAEHGDLVAYGFENQRIAVPAARIGAVRIHRGWGKQWGRTGPALLVLDKSGRMLLRAPGAWGALPRSMPMTPDLRPGSAALGSLGELCDSLKIARPEYLTAREVRQQKATWQRAPGYQKVRIRSRGYLLTLLALAVFGLIAGGLGVAVGVLLARLLPWDIGDVRNLIGMVLCGAAVYGTFRLCNFTLRALNWLAVSRNVGALAPPGRFFGARYRRRSRKLAGLLTVLMVASIPALIVWGPLIGLVSLAHGFSDQALVSTLRQGSISTPGYVIDVPTYSTDSNGNTVVTDHPTLLFQTSSGVTMKTPDPAIAGWTWPMNPQQQVTIVYEPSDPTTAAVAGQISGSPWHGAPTGNVIAGALLTVALIPLTWLTVRRIRNKRRASREGFFEGMV